MSYLFQDKNSFNSDISAWDVSNVTDMEGIFMVQTSFNGDLSSWDVSNATILHPCLREPQVLIMVTYLLGMFQCS